MKPIPRLSRLIAAPAALLSAGLALGACSPLKALDALTPDEGYRLVGDVAYGDHPRMRFDLYLPPEGRMSDAPPVLFFHGGSWRRGGKDGYRFIGQAFASRGVPIAVAEYRVFPEIRYPTFAEDAGLAAKRLLEMAPAHGLPSRFVVMGHSAGAHTAAALALEPRYLEGAGVDPATRAGLISIAGPVYIDPQEYRTTRPVFAPVADDPERGRPALYASADDPPAYIIHGAEDGTVYPINSEKLADRLRAVGVPVELSLRAEEGHIGPLLALSHVFEESDDPLTDRLAAWIKGL
ncbi:MAG: alpha/beta hydrolase [Marivibrio sp.]|uniref:alpha/beta hydrolase n=1 Tax=Marivibrio sp. TaxID=2039719 RepID=UPI0032EC0075